MATLALPNFCLLLERTISAFKGHSSWSQSPYPNEIFSFLCCFFHKAGSLKSGTRIFITFTETVIRIFILILKEIAFYFVAENLKRLLRN